MQAIQDYLRKNEPRFIRELCEYLRFPSVSAQPKHRADLAACAQWLVRHCQEIGLQTRLCPTQGNPVILARTPRLHSARRPHFLVYGHYDVQPAEPFELWKSPPFEPRIERGSLYARGATDNKGQHLAHLNAGEAYFKTKTEL
ncbi:MAG: M20/M25/M40 family metallo-hydrolase, partial [Verrucomicrobiota bacterium]